MDYNLSLFKGYAYNYLDEKSWRFRNSKSKPTFSLLSAQEQKSQKKWEARKALFAILADPSKEKYLRINHGARSGSIAKAVGFESGLNSQGDGFTWNAKIILLFDGGKQVNMKVLSLFEKLDDVNCAVLMTDYKGPTLDTFTKTKREPEVAMQIFDRFKKEINVGDWLLSSGFAIGKVRRISAKGTMWVSFIARTDQDAAAFADMRCSDPHTFAKLIVPDEFDSVAQLMDYNMPGMIADLAIDFKG